MFLARVARPSALRRAHGLCGAKRALSSPVTAVTTPDDANPMGLVHGGEVLKLLERAGSQAATELLGEGQIGVLARLETVAFRTPISVGEEVTCDANVIFTSPHSVAVDVKVTATDPSDPSKPPRLSNESTLWYIGIEAASCFGNADRKFPAVSVPPLAASAKLESEPQARAQALYDARRAEKAAACAAHAVFGNSTRLVPGVGADNSPQAAVTELAQLMLPSDAPLPGGLVPGGAVMKLMDSAAAICATRHARKPSVTAAIDAVDLRGPVRVGDVVSVTARPTFCSAKSLEVHVEVKTESMHAQRTGLVTHEAYFTFVAVDENGRAAAQPKMVLETEGDLLRFRDGERRYVQRRQARQSSS